VKKESTSPQGVFDSTLILSDPLLAVVVAAGVWLWTILFPGP